MVNLNAQTQIIAHRGYWKTDDNAQNSIKSLQKAAEIKAYGSEMDVHLTVDDVLIVFHDDVLNGKRIDESTFDELSLHVLNNGEKIPTLKDYLIEGKKYPDLKLIVELKPHQTHEIEDRLVEKTLALIEELNLDDQVEYISFSQNICTQLKYQQPRALVSYLNGDLSPKQVKARKWDGIETSIKLNDADQQTLTFGPLTLDNYKYEAKVSGKSAELTLREFELLKFLATQQGQVFSREELLEKVWGYDYFGDVRTVDVTIRRIREKIEENPSEPEFLATKRGIGYYFNAN